MGIGQYNILGEYFDPHTASSVFLILLFYTLKNKHVKAPSVCSQAWSYKHVIMTSFRLAFCVNPKSCPCATHSACEKKKATLSVYFCEALYLNAV